MAQDRQTPNEFHDEECADCPGGHECPNPCWRCVSAREDYLLARINELEERLGG